MFTQYLLEDAQGIDRKPVKGWLVEALLAAGLAYQVIAQPGVIIARLSGQNK